MILFEIFVLVHHSVGKQNLLGTPTNPFEISSDPTHPRPGISIEVLKRVMEEMGGDYQIKFHDAVARAVKEAQKGEGEMLISYSIKKERLKYLAYPQESYRMITWSCFIRKEDEGKILFEQLEDLKGLQIGVVRGTSYSKKFWDAETYLQFLTVSKSILPIRMLLKKRIDIAPLNTRSTLYDLKKAGLLDKITYLPKPLTTKPYYDPIIKRSSYFDPPQGSTKTKDEIIQEFLNRYDAVIKKFKEDGTIEKIYNKYGYQYEF